jgi:hypothetical protein
MRKAIALLVDALTTGFGIALIAIALRDIFDTLFHPSGRSVLSRSVARAVWRAVGALGGRFEAARVVAGPLGYLAVLATWTTMLVVGWTLIFLPHMPEGYTYGQGLDPAAHDSFSDALYFSLENITSLGYGDIAPHASGLRILGPIETAFGLGLLTASISWLISIHAALARRDAFAHRIHLAQEAEQRLGEKLADADPDLFERTLVSFTDDLVVSRRDLIHFPITFYFASEDRRLALSDLTPFLDRMIGEAAEDGRPHAVRVGGETLKMALEDFQESLRGRLGVDPRGAAA